MSLFTTVWNLLKKDPVADANDTFNVQTMLNDNWDKLDAALGLKNGNSDVRVATTVNITLSGTQTIDGIAVAGGDRVLVKDQTNGSQNGLYVVATGAWLRAADADTTAKIAGGISVYVKEGTANGKTEWRMSNLGAVTLGTTVLTFQQMSGVGSATDIVIGKRTIDDTVTATSGADTPTRLLSMLGNMIKGITGKPNWYSAPVKTLEQINTDINAHLADYTLQVPYVADTGTANAKAVALNPTATAYVEGLAMAFKNKIDSTGAATINVNGLGAKSILDSKGNALASGKLKANSIYTLRYNGTAFILQGEGGDYGTAAAAQVLSPYTTGTDAGIVAGTMPNRSGDTAALASSVFGTTLKLRASDGYRNGISDYVTITDPDFIAANIRSGVDLFGLVGSLVQGKQFASGLVPSLTTSTLSFMGRTMGGSGSFSNTSFNYVQVSGLAFNPSFIILRGNFASSTTDWLGIYNVNGLMLPTYFGGVAPVYMMQRIAASSTDWIFTTGNSLSAAGGFIFPVINTFQPVNWWAFE